MIFPKNADVNEMTILKIPINQIRVNPNDPRKGVSAGAVENKMTSLQENGQETPIKVRPLSPDERASDPSYLYELIGGHLRLAAAQRLGWPTLDAMVLNVSAEEGEWKAFMDNNWQDMNWLSCYLAVERRMQLRPDLTQQQIAAQWGVDAAKVSWVVKVMKALNQGARGALHESFNLNSAKEPISEIAMRRLTDLLTGKVEDMEIIEKSLQVALDRQMTEPQIAQLVRWVQSGQEPSSFPVNGEKASHGSKAAQDPTDPYASIWKELPSNARVIKGKTGYELRLKLAPSEAPVAVYSALAAIEHLKETALLPDSPPADPRFAQALPNLATEARRVKVQEQNLQAAHEEEKRKNREAEKTRKAQAAQAQKEAQKSKAVEYFNRDIKMHLETGFGPGPLADGLHQKVMSGQKAEAYKAIRATLSVMGKNAEEQEAYIKPLKVNLSKLSRLNSNKPKVKNPLPGVISGKSTALSQSQANVAETAVGSAHTLAPSEPIHPEPVVPAQMESSQSNPGHTPGLFDLLKGAVEKMGENVNSGTLLDKGLEMLEKNAKQTTNYEMRKGMRHLFNDIL